LTESAFAAQRDYILSLYLCVQDNSKSFKPILMEFFGGLGMIQGGSDWILVATILSLILDDPRFFCIRRWGIHWDSVLFAR